MEHATLCIHDFLTTDTQRCINQVILLFSLNSKLNININGKQTSVENNIAIINHSDLFCITHAEQLVELKIPIQQIIPLNQLFFNCYYDAKALHAQEYLKYLILNMIEKLNTMNSMELPQLTELISTLEQETKKSTDYAYIPTIHSENELLNKISDYIQKHITQHIMSKEISSIFYISSSYISILFKKYLGISFKHYVVSLKIALSINELINSNKTIYLISENMGFNHYANYTHQFKYHLKLTPLAYRKKLNILHNNPITLLTTDISGYSHYFKAYLDDHNQSLDNEIINLDHLKYNDLAKQPTIFIHIDNLMDIIQTNLNQKLNFSDLTNCYLLINNVSNLASASLNLNGIVNLIDAIFSNCIGVVIRIKSMEEYKKIEQVISQFLIFKPKYHANGNMYNFMILFDSEYLKLNDINRLYIKVRSLNINIKLAINVEGVLTQTQSLKHTFTLLHRFNFDFNFIDVERSELRTMLLKHSHQFDNVSSYSDYYNKFVTLSKLQPNKCVYSKLTKNHFTQYNQKAPLGISEIMQHTIQLIKNGSAVGYELMNKCIYDVALMNHHGIYEPIVYIMQFLKPFYGKAILIQPNYLVAKDKQCTHLLLFNANTHTTLNKRKFILKQQTIISKLILFIRTLNREHGFIDYALPPIFNDIFIEQSLLKNIERSNMPKSELRHTTYPHTPIEFDIGRDEVKYIRLSPTNK
ncbi:AraC family transcriptional regulator Rsp [Staphylococcus ureilyticus]|uniref:AraC family transcriptional regulator Rsp n=1 Tax=Staphylococcus ureilyticus TaxID=94138 RepID=UPI0034DD1903